MKEIVTYRYGSFNDYKGQEHKVIVCALSACVDNKDIIDGVSIYDGELDPYGVNVDITKILSFGVSICNPADNYSKEHGEVIAYNRAKKYTKCPFLLSNHAGFFNTFTVDAIANNYLEYIQRDPGSIINGYDIAKQKFIEDQALKEEVSKMSKEDKDRMKIISKCTQEDIEYSKKIAKYIV